jgi:uncharacterized protein YozE (UPF0346 family)
MEFDSEIKKAKLNILKKTGINILYPVIVGDFGSIGGFCQFDKTIHIDKDIVNDKELLSKVIYHEFLHLFLQVDTKLFYDVLRDRYISTYFFYLNKYCNKYQVLTIYPYCDVWIKFKQTNTEGLRNVNKLVKNNSLSKNYNQFNMLTEFIIHNSDYYFETNFNDELFEDHVVLEMNKFVFNLILENINKHTEVVKRNIKTLLK